MALFEKDKLLSKVRDVADVAKDVAGKTAASAKTGLSQAKATIDEKREQSQLAKLPQEGGLKRYEVTYRGGNPQYELTKEVRKYPYILMDVMPDRLSFLPNKLSEPWFSGFELPYGQIITIEIVERTIGNAEMLLSSGSDNSDLRQKNVLEIKYVDSLEDEYVMRVEMLTGISVMGQARVCLELMDLLRTNKILKLFRGANGGEPMQNRAIPAAAPSGGDIIEQMKKLAELKDMGILTEEEFSSKKTELLSKI